MDLFSQPTIEEATALRDEVLSRAKCTFITSARAFIIKYLRENGRSPGEDITDAAKRSGIRPHDDRSFGPVFGGLSRDNVIKKVDFIPRRKGHATSGGIIWALA